MLWSLAKPLLPWIGTAISLAAVWLLWGRLKVAQAEVRLLETLARTLKVVGNERQKHIEALNAQLAERHERERKRDAEDAASMSAADFLRHSGR